MRHAIQIHVEEVGHGSSGGHAKACCACGWTGPSRSAWNMARHDGLRHVDPIRSVANAPVGASAQVIAEG